MGDRLRGIEGVREAIRGSFDLNVEQNVAKMILAAGFRSQTQAGCDAITGEEI